MQKPKIYPTLLAILTIVLIGSGVWSCSNPYQYTYEVEGQVTDLSGKVLPNATVELGSSNVTTDSNGHYLVRYTKKQRENPPSIKATISGYDPVTQFPGAAPGKYTLNFVLNPSIDVSAMKVVGPAKSGLLGDVNGDKAITIIDSFLAAKCANHQPVIECNPDVTDVNGSGTIDIIDALLIAQYSTGKITTFPRNK